MIVSLHLLKIDVLIFIVIINAKHMSNVIGSFLRRFTHYFRIFIFELSQCKSTVRTIAIEIPRITTRFIVRRKTSFQDTNACQTSSSFSEKPVSSQSSSMSCRFNGSTAAERCLEAFEPMPRLTYTTKKNKAIFIWNKNQVLFRFKACALVSLCVCVHAYTFSLSNTDSCRWISYESVNRTEER